MYQQFARVITVINEYPRGTGNEMMAEGPQVFCGYYRNIRG